MNNTVGPPCVTHFSCARHFSSGDTSLCTVATATVSLQSLATFMTMTVSALCKCPQMIDFHDANSECIVQMSTGDSQGTCGREACLPEEWLECDGRVSRHYLPGRHSDLNHSRQQSTYLRHPACLQAAAYSAASQVKIWIFFSFWRHLRVWQ